VRRAPCVCLVVALLLSGCAIGASNATGRVRVVAAENFWGSIVTQLAGPDATVTSIVRNPNADPHDYEPTTADARAFAEANYVVINGLGYDAWARQLLDANPTNGRTVLDVGRFLGLPSGSNPHQWYSPAVVTQFVARVVADLAAIDPAHRSGYEQRGRAFETGALAAYHALIAQIQTRFGGRVIGASESIVVPLAAALGLRVATPAPFLEAVSEGNEPSAADKATADSQLFDGSVGVFVDNRQDVTPDVQRLIDEARAHSIPVVSITETLAPASATFQSWQTAQLRALRDALAEAGGAG
jgi:zinc/manganese transport system substrate-binding protein